MLLRSRIAPTPSGYLHIGNAMNFVLTWLWIRKAGGRLRLRIDDSDTTRSKPEFIEDIFCTLDWLGLDWDEGPLSPDEQLRIYSQALRREPYFKVITQLIDTGKVFACECSRKDLLVRPCNCLNKNIGLNHPETALRISTPTEAIIVTDTKSRRLSIILSNEIKDFVIRRRDGIPAYQVASLADDVDFGINLILRGEDLLSSTAAQLYLASLIHPNGFAETRFYHHPLLKDERNIKLSKSAGSLSLKTIREQGTTTTELYSKLSKLIGLIGTYESLNEMLKSNEPLLSFMP